MNTTFPIRLRTLGIFLFGLIILWLQGVYFGGYLKTLYVFGLLLPIVSTWFLRRG